MSQRKDVETNGNGSTASGLTQVKQGGLQSVVNLKCYWLVLIAVLGAGLVGLAIGLYFIGQSNGAASATVLSITTRPPLSSTTASNTAAVTPTPNLEYRLPRTVFPVHYKLTLFPNLYLPNVADFTTKGWEIVTVSVHVPTDRIFLHADRYQIDINSVQLFENLPDDEEPLPTASAPGTTTSSNIALVHHFHHATYAYYEFVFNQTLALRQYKLRLSWSGKLGREQFNGLFLSSYTVDGRTHYLAATQFQPTHTRKAFPCFDEPEMKAVFETRLIRAEAYVALTNTFAIKTEDIIIEGKSYKIDYFAPSVYMSSYLNAFAVHDYGKLEYFDSSRNIRYRFWGRKGWLDKMEYIASITPPLLNHFDYYYGTQYPLNKMEFIAVPDFGGAMENWGLVTFSDTFFYYDANKDPFAQKESIAAITAHELGHMNFGNLVTCKWWEDTWLNEGFASYEEYIGMTAVESTWDSEQKLLISNVLSSMRIDCTNATRPISQPASSPSSVSGMFDTITYSKGAALCRMMSAFLTEKTFRTALTAYLNTFKFGSVVHKNLFDSLTAQTIIEGNKKDVHQIMQGWTTQAGYPVLTGRLQTSNAQSLTIEVSQTPFELDKGKFGFRTWWIPIQSIVSTNPSIINADLNWLSTNSSTITIIDSTLSSWNNNGWFILNANHGGFYRVNYDLSNWQRLTDQLYRNHAVVNALTRTQLIDDAHNLARGGYPVMTYNLAFSMTSYLCNDLDYAPWQATLDNMNYVQQMLIHTEYDPFMKNYGRIISNKVYSTLGWESSDPETSTVHFLRTSIISQACRWQNNDCVEKSKGHFVSWRNDINYLPPTDTISTVRCYGIKSGSTEDWRWLYSVYFNTSSQSERNSLISALSCSDDVALLEWFLNVSYGNPTIPGQEFTTIYIEVAGNPLAYDLALDCLFRNYRTLLIESPSQSGPRRILDAAFQYANKQSQLDEILAWKESVGNLAGAETTFNNAVVTIRNNIAWMDAHETEVGQWLRDFNSNALPASCATA